MKTSVLWQKYQNSKRLANTTFARYQIVVNRLNEISDEFPLSGIEVNELSTSNLNIISMTNLLKPLTR
jgi:hypothetical protein